MKRKIKTSKRNSARTRGLVQAQVVVEMTHKLNAVCRAMDGALSKGIEVTFALETAADGTMFIRTLTVAKKV